MKYPTPFNEGNLRRNTPMLEASLLFYIVIEIVGILCNNYFAVSRICAIFQNICKLFYKVIAQLKEDKN